MGKGRLEAFSDAVIAIIITIMVLEMKVQHGDDFATLKPLLPVFMSYILSFIYIGIYWNNHHHLMHVTHKINGKVMWANSHLLFWLSLMPFASGWMGENHFATLPTALFGVILLMAGVAYYILAQCLIRLHGKDSTLGKAVGNDRKGIISVVIYAAAIGLSLLNPWISVGLYGVVAIIWLVPDRRIELKLMEEEKKLAD
ncbi:MAG: TMEM175 family protein [Bacteroidota bacterium]